MKSLKLLFIIIRIKIADMEIKDTYNTLKEKYLDVLYFDSEWQFLFNNFYF